MKFFIELFRFLTSREFLVGLIDRLYVLIIGFVFYLTLIVCFLYKPALLFYLIAAGMFAMFLLMVYFIFPEFHQKIYAIKSRIIRIINKLSRS